MKRTKGVELKSSFFKINQDRINEISDASSGAENNGQAPINGNGGALFSAENSDDSYITARSHVSEEFKTARSYKEVDPAAAAAAAQKIIRGFKSYKEETYINDLLSRQKTPKELEPSSQTTRKDYFHSRQEIVKKLEPKKTFKDYLYSKQEILNKQEPSSQTTRKDYFYSRQEILKALESISQTTMKKWRFSTDAIKEFIVFATKGSCSIALEQFYTNYHHYKENREIDDSIPYDVWRTRWYKTYPEMKETLEPKKATLEPKKATLESEKATLESEKATLESEYVGDFSRALFELSYGDASGESQAIILRAYLIKTLPLDILKQIGEENIMVAGYKGVNHAFVVVKRFYGKTDEPADCLVIDTYIADLYLRDIEHYRPEAAYPISHFYYSALLRNTNHKDLKRIMATEFPQQGVPNVHEKRKPYMGRMQGHFEFLHDYVKKPDVPNNFPAELKLVDRTFYYLENTVAYNNAYLLIEEGQPFVYKRL